VGLDDDPPGAVRTLGGAVQRALLGAGVDVAERRVWPHLTLARARRRRRVPADLVAAISLPAVSWTVRHVEVVESVLGRGPAAYRTVATVPVGD
jgi:2'-5' RNA ligase